MPEIDAETLFYSISSLPFCLRAGLSWSVQLSPSCQHQYSKYYFLTCDALDFITCASEPHCANYASTRGVKNLSLSTCSIRLVPGASSSIELSIWKYRCDRDMNQWGPWGSRGEAKGHLKSSMRRIGPQSDSDSAY